MCAAVAGQCGSDPNARFNSQSHFLDQISHLYADRNAELQSIWQDIGEDTWQKLHELSQMLSNAVDEIYKKVLEESKQRKSELEERVSRNETRLRENVGASPSQVVAPMELHLHGWLSINTAPLQDANANLHIGVGESVVLKKLCSQILALREMLKLSPCSNSSLDEVLASTIADLHKFCSGKACSNWFSYKDRQSECPSMFQLLHRFNWTLQTMEKLQMNHLFIEAEKSCERFHDCGPLVGPNLQGGSDSKKMTFRERSLKDSSKGSRPAKFLTDDISTLEKLGCKILRKLEDTMKQLKYAAQCHSDTYSCSSSTGMPSVSEYPEFHTLVDDMLSPEETRAGAQATALTTLHAKNYTTSSHCVRGNCPSTWQENNVLGNPQLTCATVLCQDQSSTIDRSWVAQYAKDLKNDNSNEHDSSLKQSHADSRANTLPDPYTNTKHDTSSKEQQNITCTASKRLPLIPITNNQLAAVSIGKPWHGLSHPPPPPPPPPPQQQPPQQPSLQPPPPPPPPPPPLPPPRSTCSGTRSAQACKLKKSASLSRLYMGMKKKAEGAASNLAATADVASQRRALIGIGAREGMAEALAEITKRSAYFRKIEDDVNNQANSILEMKSRLETFETYDMNELLKFHRSMEVQLEQLTDESQVLARFEGFPIRKLETVRAAASLYLRLTSLVEQIENWVAEPPPLCEQLEKVTALFDKVKTDMEAIERTKDEDFQRFNSQKICFNFEIINSIKEATVRLSSHCLASTLKESHRTEKKVMIGDAYPCTKDTNKRRASFQMLYKAFQLAYRVHNFAGGHDERAEQLCSEVALEMEGYPSSFWVELANKL